MTPELLNNSQYCFTSAFLGSVKTLSKSSSVRAAREAMTGTLPMNLLSASQHEVLHLHPDSTHSGMKPNRTRSAGSTALRSAGPSSTAGGTLGDEVEGDSLAVNPIDPFVRVSRAETIFSRPTLQS